MVEKFKRFHNMSFLTEIHLSGSCINKILIEQIIYMNFGNGKGDDM